ncbi:MAG: hypothetical protein WDN06_06900 [Asticcacaulis sp.]
MSITPDDNTLIAYSTDLGHTGRHRRPMRPCWAKELLKPGEKITDVFANVQIDVGLATGQKQHPWINNRIYDVICLASCEVKVTAPAGNGLSEAAQRMEQTFWTSIQGCDDYKAYLDRYPAGNFASLAKSRLAAPACQTAPAVAVVTPPPPQQQQQPVTTDAAYQCDVEAGEEFDNDRPRGNPFVTPGKLVPDRALAACQKALDADPVTAT